jgi:hypothetical protein
MILNKDNLCDFCANANKYIKAKEKAVGQFLMSKEDLHIESYDKVIDASCNYKRPDFVIDALLFKIIVEVDEGQHKSYPCECEQKRMIMVHQSFGGTPVVFIRYNPDAFKDYKNKKADVNRNTRLNTLYNLIKNLKNNEELDIPLSAYYLYYDGFNKNSTDKICIQY